MESMGIMGIIAAIIGIIIPIVWSLVLYKFGELLTKHEDFLNYIGIKEIEDNYEMRKLINSMGEMLKLYAIISVVVRIVRIVFPMF